ncbi:putative amino acid permease 7 [Camellia lanceoleosa]|uniref:Amino acid permease 7 n=1 Tax=Camellia lanceoleosa TaxID=1840588 RepID=A0ACC0HAS7_9ERIC|nr:putative amino acid permease 7 [Camellia lanceoleosa]
MGVVTEDHHQTPLFLQSSLALSPHDQPIQRTGNVWTAVAHIITGVIGSGILSLAWCMAQLGWIGGSFSMLFFAFITLISAFLLSNCCRSPHPELGPTRNHSYLEAVHFNLGKRSAAVCSVFLRLNFLKVGVVYTITSAISMRAIQKSNCYHKEGHEAACEYGSTSNYMLLFGIVQALMSQIPNFRDGNIKGGIGGVPASTTTKKVWLVAQALGDIAFAFPFSVILIEIQKASTAAISITTFFYLCCAGFGYAAFGNSTPGNLLTGFGFYEPYWLIDFANACIILHLVGGYQVFSQPLFADLEGLIAEKFPNSRFINKNYILKVPPLPAFRLNLLRLCFRTTYVALTTGLAMLFPYFNQVVGVAGSLNFWPLVVFFPTQMYIVQKNIGPWTRKWIGVRIFTLVCLCVTLFALVGSLEGLITAKFG